MKSAHVLFVLSQFHIGGAEIDVMNLSTALLKRGYRVTIASQGGELESRLPSDVGLLHLPILSNAPWAILWNVCRLLLFCIGHRVTVLNPQSLRGMLLLIPASKLGRLPLLATIHNLHSQHNSHRAVRLLNRWPDLVMFVSDFERNKFIKMGLRPEISKVIYSGIDLDCFHEKILKTDAMWIGVVGRLSPEKGIHLAIEAFSKIHLVFPKAKLMVVGDGPERHSLEKLVQQKGLDAKVVFLGAQNDIPHILSQLRLLVLPSLSESLSVVAREAMATKVPVIATDVGGMSELIRHAFNGLLVPSGDVQHLAEAIEVLLESPHLAQHLGRQGRAEIEQRFSMQCWVSNMDRLYRKACGASVPCLNKRPKLLYLTTRFPLPTIKGDKLRAFHQICELSKTHDVLLVSLSESPDDERYLGEMEKYCYSIVCIPTSAWKARLLRSLFHCSWLPSQLGYFHCSELKQLLPRLVLSHDIDVVLCQLIRGAQYAMPLKNVRKVVDFVDAFSLNLKRNVGQAPWYCRPELYLKMLKVSWYEQRVLRVFDHAFIISENDKKALKSDSLTVIPNGVVCSSKISTKSMTEPDSIIFTGNLDYWPNQDAITFLMKSIVPHLASHIRVYLVGVNHNPEVFKYQSERVIVTGEVASIHDALQKATVAVCPMRLGAGLQNKVLEAMAAGLPVVATSIANSGVQADGIVQVEDNPLAFAQKINELVQNPSTRQNLGLQGQEFVRQHFSWATIMQNMEQELWKEKPKEAFNWSEIKTVSSSN